MPKADYDLMAIMYSAYDNHNTNENNKHDYDNHNSNYAIIIVIFSLRLCILKAEAISQMEWN